MFAFLLQRPLEPVDAPTGPACAAVDWMSGATCTLVGGHTKHESVDRDCEFRWPLVEGQPEAGT